MSRAFACHCCNCLWACGSYDKGGEDQGTVGGDVDWRAPACEMHAESLAESSFIKLKIKSQPVQRSVFTRKVQST